MRWKYAIIYQNTLGNQLLYIFDIKHCYWKISDVFRGQNWVNYRNKCSMSESGFKSTKFNTIIMNEEIWKKTNKTKKKTSLYFHMYEIISKLTMALKHTLFYIRISMMGFDKRLRIHLYSLQICRILRFVPPERAINITVIIRGAKNNLIPGTAALRDVNLPFENWQNITLHSIPPLPSYTLTPSLIRPSASAENNDCYYFNRVYGMPEISCQEQFILQIFAAEIYFYTSVNNINILGVFILKLHRECSKCLYLC